MITIGYSTRESNTEFQEYLKKSCGHPKVQIIEKVNNGEKNLSQVYNEIIKESIYDIVVLCHDDIYFDTNNWANKLVKTFSKNPEFAILGMAGTTHMPKSGMWWEDRSKMWGIVNHENEGRKWESRYSNSLNNEIKEVVVVDGVFISIDKTKISETFDESVDGFHMYDINFCFKNFLSGVKIGVITNIRITHKSIGMTNDSWENNRVKFSKKYFDFLPAKINYKNTDKLNVLISCLSFQKFTGSEMYVYELSKKLVQENCEVTVVASETNGPLVQMAQKNGIKVFNIRETPGYKLGDGKWMVNTPDGIAPSIPNNYYKIDEVHFDIIHCQHTPIVNVMNMLYPTIDKISTIHSEVISLENPIVHPTIKKYIAIRPEIKEHLINNFNISSEKIEVIYNPIDTDKFNKKNIQSENYILFVGTIDYLREKTIKDLVEYSKENNKKLLLVGENKSNYLPELLSNSHVSHKNATLDVEKYIHKCCETAGILLGRTTIEGWMCGKPGWIYDVDDYGNIKDKKLHTPPDYLENFDSNIVSKKIKEEYVNILNETKEKSDKKFFEFFDKSVCINLEKRKDRKHSFIEQSQKLNLGDFEFFEAIEGNKNNIQSNLLPGEIGVILSNYEIIKTAKDENLSNILIMEDDCVFKSEITDYQKLLDFVPSDWDMIYFGGNHNLHDSTNIRRINDKVIKITNTFAIHCVAIKSHLFDEILNNILKCEKQIDVVYTDLQKKYNVYSFFPAVASQFSDFSDIQNKHVDYNYLIQ